MGSPSALDDAESYRLPAGNFSWWLGGLQDALAGDRDSDVPCGTCTACCTSSQFIHIAPDETETLALVPKGLRFPAPGLPTGHVLMGHDERGHCPMLRDDSCSIYAHRPRTCRTYDCRIFPATGVDVGDDKARIAERARRWRFSFDDEIDHTRHEATRTAATYLVDHRHELPDGAVPAQPTPLAVLAIEVHDTFLGHDEGSGRTEVAVPSYEAVAAALTIHRPPRRLDMPRNESDHRSA